MANTNLQNAKTAKKDEFYTQLTDIEKELRHYKEHFQDKTVICNCDDPRVSNFFVYFKLNFKHLGLKRLICTCYKHQDVDLFGDHSEDKAVYIDFRGGEENILPLKGDGDFRSQECIELLKQADIVVTNPPFSLFREYVAQLVKYEKKFLIIGNQNAITYKEIFPLLKENKIWIGYKFGDMAFRVPDEYEMRETRSWRDENGDNWRSLGNACWFTNLDHEKRHEPVILYKKYKDELYPHYDNFDAIEVNKVAEIPGDYFGMIGVPITYMDKYCPEQFVIIGSFNNSSYDDKEKEGYVLSKDTPTIINGAVKLWNGPVVNKKPLYKRIVIRRKQQE